MEIASENVQKLVLTETINLTLSAAQVLAGSRVSELDRFMLVSIATVVGYVAAACLLIGTDDRKNIESAKRAADAVITKMFEEMFEKTAMAIQENRKKKKGEQNET